MDSKLTYLQIIQSTIGRMASNSFLMKGWTVTLVSALFALSAKDADKAFVTIAYLPIFMFWILDAYFLSQERRFRKLYDNARKQDGSSVDFSMDTTPFSEFANSWGRTFFSQTLIIFYGLILITVLSVAML